MKSHQILEHLRLRRIELKTKTKCLVALSLNCYKNHTESWQNHWQIVAARSAFCRTHCYWKKICSHLLQYFPPKDVTLRNVCFVYGYNRFTEMPIRSPTLYNGLKDGYSNFFWIALMCRTRLAFEMIYSTNSFLSLNRAMCERRDFVRDLFERCAR